VSRAIRHPIAERCPEGSRRIYSTVINKQILRRPATLELSST
jgi:hypothetical protein